MIPLFQLTQEKKINWKVKHNIIVRFIYNLYIVVTASLFYIIYFSFTFILCYTSNNSYVNYIKCIFYALTVIHYAISTLDIIHECWRRVLGQRGKHLFNCLQKCLKIVLD